MKRIPLSQGRYAIVDDNDFAWLSAWKWYFSGEYAIRGVRHKDLPRGYQSIMMHRLINQTADGFETDHINRDKLDNRRSNLRTATRAENRYNTDLRADNTSGVKGVSWYKQTHRWVAKASIDGKLKTLGYYKDKADAIKARQDAVSDFIC